MTDGYMPEMQDPSRSRGLNLSAGPSSSSYSPISGQRYDSSTEPFQKAVYDSDLSGESYKDSLGKALKRGVNIKRRNTKPNKSRNRLSTPSLTITSKTRQASCKRPESSNDSPDPPTEGSKTPTDSIHLGNSPKAAPGSKDEILLSDQRTTQPRNSSSTSPTKAHTQLQGQDRLENHIDDLRTRRDRSRALMRGSDPDGETNLDRDTHVSTVEHTKQALGLPEPKFVEVQLRLEGCTMSQWIYLDPAIWCALCGGPIEASPRRNPQLTFVGNAAKVFEDLVYIIVRLRAEGYSKSMIQRQAEDYKNSMIATFAPLAKSTQSAIGFEFSYNVIRCTLHMYEMTKRTIAWRFTKMLARLLSDSPNRKEYLLDCLTRYMVAFAVSLFRIRDPKCEELMVDLVKDEDVTENSNLERVFIKLTSSQDIQ